MPHPIGKRFENGYNTNKDIEPYEEDNLFETKTDFAAYFGSVNALYRKLQALKATYDPLPTFEEKLKVAIQAVKDEYADKERKKQQRIKRYEAKLNNIKYIKKWKDIQQRLDRDLDEEVWTTVLVFTEDRLDGFYIKYSNKGNYTVLGDKI